VKGKSGILYGRNQVLDHDHDEHFITMSRIKE
jgi:hypothetical protein